MHNRFVRSTVRAYDKHRPYSCICIFIGQLRQLLNRNFKTLRQTTSSVELLLFYFINTQCIRSRFVAARAQRERRHARFAPDAGPKHRRLTA